MALVESLLAAISRADGDALVMHVGEKPYIVTAGGQIELSSKALTLEAVQGMLARLLPPEQQQALTQLGAVEHPLPWTGDEADRFRVVVARGGDDIWIEICRVRPPVEPPAPARAPEPVPVSEPVVEAPVAVAPPVGPPPAPETIDEAETIEPVHPAAWPSVTAAAEPMRREMSEDREPRVEPIAPATYERADRGAYAMDEEPDAVTIDLRAGAAPPRDQIPADEIPADPLSAWAPPPSAMTPPAPPPPVHLVSIEPPARRVDAPEPPAYAEPGARAADETPSRAGDEVTERPAAYEPQPAVVVPMLRGPVRAEPAPPAMMPGARAGLDRLLRFAAARGASTLYIVAQMRPVIRVDGEIMILTNEAPLSAADVQTLLLDLAPEPTREALRSGMITEWICDVPDVGRVRCMSFNDHRGPGGIFRMIPARAISADQLGLSREIQALCAQPDGLVLVTGPRSSDKSTLVAAFVDLINRTRSDHVITLERQIKFVHESRRSFVSQREVRGGTDEMVASARAALREDPDVLVIEELRSAEMIDIALEAAESGRLVVGELMSPSTTAAIERIVDQCPADRRPHVQQMLAATLHGVVAQVLLRKTGGGRLAARELLLNTAPVANLIAGGQTFQLPLALDSGRKHGMVPLNDALAAFVQSGAVDVREAYRKAADREGLLNVLRRTGIDTSFLERLA